MKLWGLVGVKWCCAGNKVHPTHTGSAKLPSVLLSIREPDYDGVSKDSFFFRFALFMDS